MNTTEIKVQGMTCEHCVKSVTEELTELDGVKDVQVSLVPGGDSPVTISHEGNLDAAKVEQAVDEAGYSLAN